jgi:hypothetical protein
LLAHVAQYVELNVVVRNFLLVLKKNVDFQVFVLDVLVALERHDFEFLPVKEKKRAPNRFGHEKVLLFEDEIRGRYRKLQTVLQKIRLKEGQVLRVFLVNLEKRVETRFADDVEKIENKLPHVLRDLHLSHVVFFLLNFFGRYVRVARKIAFLKVANFRANVVLFFQSKLLLIIIDRDAVFKRVQKNANVIVVI